MAAHAGVRARVLATLDELGYGTEIVTDKTHFEDDLHMDDLDYLELVTNLEEVFADTEVPPLQFPDRRKEPDIAHTLGAHIKYICDQTGLPE